MSTIAQRVRTAENRIENGSFVDAVMRRLKWFTEGAPKGTRISAY